MKVYLVTIEDDVEYGMNIEVYKTFEDAHNRVKHIVDSYMNSKEELFGMHKEICYKSKNYDWVILGLRYEDEDSFDVELKIHIKEKEVLKCK